MELCIINEQSELDVYIQDENKILNSNDENVFLNIEKAENHNNLKKRKIGYLYAFYYKNGEPMILVGPHCNFNLK